MKGGKKGRQSEEMRWGVSGRKNWATEHNSGRKEMEKKEKSGLEKRERQ